MAGIAHGDGIQEGAGITGAGRAGQLDANLLRRVEAARAHLCDHYAEKITLAELARLADLSPFRLARLFRSLVGTPPHAYQIQLRIERAKLLLAEGRPVSDVAQETGFFDLSHFTRHFKHHAGIPPGEYGARCRLSQQESALPRCHPLAAARVLRERRPTRGLSG